jgi:hypothetical protein
MSLFLSRLNRTLTVVGQTQTGTDGGGQPIYTEASKGTVRGRVDPKVRPDEVNGPNLNPTISEYRAITALPDGFAITTADKLTTDSLTYEVLGVAILDGRADSHHMELDLRRIS